MKESLSAIPKQPVFRETFTDEQTTRLNGGVPTAVTYFNGVASFNGTSSILNYVKNFNLGISSSYRIKIKINSLPTSGSKFIFDTYGGSGSYLSLAVNSAGIVSDSYGLPLFVNGVSFSYNTFTAIVGVWYEFIITIPVLRSNRALTIGAAYSTDFKLNADFELFEIYDYTLTANEVKNLYEGKRNRIIDLKQNAPSSANYYQGVGVAGNYVSTPDAAANQITGDIEIIAKVSIVGDSGFQTLVSKWTGTSLSFIFQIAATNLLRLYINTAGSLATSTIPISTSFNGYLKVTRAYISGDVKFYTSSDGVSYTQLGATLNINVGAIIASSASVEVGSYNTGTGANFSNKIYRATISNSIGGTPVVDFNPQLYVSGTTLPSSTGETWTINGTQGFIGNGSRPEILNIDGRNGVIANKYNPENLLNYSEDFSNVIWNKGGTTINTDQTLSPINTLTADKFNETSTFDTHQIYRSFAGGVGTYTFSVYVKSAERSNIMLTIDKTNPDPTAFFNLSTGTVTSTVNSAIANIEKCADGWYRCSLTFQSTIAETFFPIIRNVISGITEVYTGIAGYGTYIWGAQLNQDTIKPYIQTFATNITSNLINTAVTPVRQGSVWAMDFNGSTSKLDCGNYDSLLGDISLIAWIKPRNTSGTKAIIRTDRLSFIMIGNQIYGNRSNGGTSANSAASSIKNKTWQMVVMTSTSTGVTNIYINGVLSGTANQALSAPIASANNITIGQYPTGGDFYSDNLSQIRIIKGILNAQECQQLFDNERHDYGI